MSLAAFPQRRQAELHDVQPVKQIFAELVRGDGLGDVAVGRGDETHVDAQFLRAADAREGAVLQKPQQLGLKRLAHVGDFVEKNRAAVGLLHASGFLFQRAGERAFFVAEQFAFEQRFGNGGAIDADVMRLAPQAQAVQRARDQFLARAAFAENQDAACRWAPRFESVSAVRAFSAIRRRSGRG